MLIPPTPASTPPPTFVIRTLLPRTVVRTIVADAMFVTSIPPVNDAVATSSESSASTATLLPLTSESLTVSRPWVVIPPPLATIAFGLPKRSRLPLTSVRSTVSVPWTWL